jgi:DNA modification methylase
MMTTTRTNTRTKAAKNKTCSSAGGSAPPSAPLSAEALLALEKRIAGKTEPVLLANLTPFGVRTRTHDEAQIALIMGSFEAFGFINPVVVDEKGRILAGHARVEAAKGLGYEWIPAVHVEYLTDDEKRAYVIADNRIAEKAGWDREALALEFEHLLSVDLGFEIDLTGFSFPEIDLLIEEAKATDVSPVAADPADVFESAPGPAVSRTGDLWLLGPHRLVCGDALDPEMHSLALNARKARLVLSDPPYNVAIGGFVSGLGKAQHREFAMASGEMSETEFTGFLGKVFARMQEDVVDGALHYIFMDFRHVRELSNAAADVGLKLLNLCVWDKQSGGMGSLYRSQHELCFVFKSGDASHLNMVELGRYGRNRTNVWSHPGLASFGRGRDEALAMHPTVKPVMLLAEAIRDCTRRGDLVLDPFLGSGSTLIAAEKTGRVCSGIEIDPLYVDTIIRRWEGLTGKKAVHAGTSLSFADLKDRRKAEAAAMEEKAVAMAAPEVEAKSEDPSASPDHAQETDGVLEGAPTVMVAARTLPSTTEVRVRQRRRAVADDIVVDDANFSPVAEVQHG